MTRIYGPSESGGTTGSTGSRWFLDYTISQNTAGNYTDIAWSAGVDFGDPNYWHNLTNGWVTWGASPGTVAAVSGSGASWSASGYYYGTSNPGTGGQAVALASGVVRIHHSASGEATATISTGTQMRSGSYTSSISTTIELPTIPRQPGAPTGLGVSGHADSDPTTATLTWSAPTDVGAGLTQRQVQISTVSDFASPVADSTASWGTSYDATGLGKATTYYARVRAASSAGWGPWSSTYTFTTGTTAPAAPTGVSASAVTSSGATITYTAPTDTGGSALTGYDVQYSTAPDFSAPVTVSDGVGSDTAITGLLPATTYYVRVRATNAVGSGAWSTGISLTTGAKWRKGTGSAWVPMRAYKGTGSAWVPIVTHSGTGSAWT